MPRLTEWITEKLKEYPEIDAKTYVPYIVGDNEADYESNVDELCDVLRDVLGEFLNEEQLEKLITDAQQLFGKVTVEDTPSNGANAEDPRDALLARSFAALATTESNRSNSKKQTDKVRVRTTSDEADAAMKEDIAQRYGVLTDTEPEEESSGSEAEGQGTSKRAVAPAKPTVEGVDLPKRKIDTTRRKEELTKRKTDAKKEDAARAQARAVAVAAAPDAKPVAAAAAAKSKTGGKK